MATITISKEEFEDILSVATSATMQVYDKCKPAIDYITQSTITDYLGDAITDDVLNDNPVLLETIKRFICYCAFRYVLPQLDLVLTPTGFGVVANNTTSPASKQRVDALDNQLWRCEWRTEGRLLHQLSRIDGWGSQSQASDKLFYPFYELEELEQRLGRDAESIEWNTLVEKAYEVKQRLYGLISRSQYDDIMTRVRCYSADNTVYNDAVKQIKDIIFLRSMNSPAEHDAWFYLMDFIDGNLDTFPIYADSQEYKANHYERYQNTKDSAAFIFAG